MAASGTLRKAKKSELVGALSSEGLLKCLHGQVNGDGLENRARRGQLSPKRRGGGKQAAHVALLDAVGLEDVGRLADLLQELLVGQLDVLSGLISLPDDGGLPERGPISTEMMRS